MIPDEVPILSASDILVDSDDYWNLEQTQATPVGWLKLLFLLPQVRENCFCSAAPKDRVDFNTAMGHLKDAMKLRARDNEVDVINWEETHTPTAQAKAFNKAMKAMGYG